MMYLLYSVFDGATKRYSPPICYESLDTLKRQIRVSASTDPTLRLCPQDFQLVPLGFFDTTNGNVLPWTTAISDTMPLLSVADVLDVDSDTMPLLSVADVLDVDKVVGNEVQ